MKSKFSKHSHLFLIALGFLWLTTMVYGQAISGDLVGAITDTSGAIVANADVRATNVNTGVTSSTKTNASGEYRFSNLPVGSYDISVSAGGLNGALRGMSVILNQTATANLTL